MRSLPWQQEFDKNGYHGNTRKGSNFSIQACFMISGICGYLSQKFMHIGKEMDKIEAEDRRGLNFHDNAHFK